MEIYWSHYTSLGKLSLCFSNSTLICQRFPLFSLQRMVKKNLVNVKCRESSQVTHHWSIFSTLTAFPSWVKIRHGKNRENTSCMSPPPNNHPQPHLPWMMISANVLRSAFSFSSATSTGWNKPTTPSPWMMMMISDKALSESFSNKVKSKTVRKKRCSRTRTWRACLLLINSPC